ncbi:MAG: DegT/DnrJ/EryC1/StrS family aminotransferase, partial [Pseudomonadales bacterium]|nr:DegT/DnrJ/EryC1/StrS family aminotransferase [Pseudomonadales bacterium]
MNNIPFFDYPHVFKKHENDFMRIIADVASRGAFIMQKDLREFESNLAKYTGAKFAVGVANATDGLQLACMAGGIEAGDEVIISSHTMVATASAIHFAGGVPIPVEAGEDLLIDPDAIEAAITEKTRAIMPTQLNGRTCDMDKITKIADKHGLKLFEDAAQALGSKFKGQSAGTFGVASAISFYPAKTLGCLGDGGAVLTNDPDVHKQLLLLRDHGRDETTGDVECWGFNTRLDNIQAAILNYLLPQYEEIIGRRRHIAALYNELLADVTEVILPPKPESGSAHFDIFQN